MSLEISNVWKCVTPELQGGIAQFWVESKAMPNLEIATERASQVVCIACSGDGTIVGVSTAYPHVVARLRQPMYYYRNFIAEPYRGKNLAIPFIQQSTEALQAYNLALPEPECIGVIIELEHTALADHFNQAYWHRTGFVFAGYTTAGWHVRVRYFDGMRLFPPGSMKEKAALLRRQAGK